MTRNRLRLAGCVRLLALLLDACSDGCGSQGSVD